MTRAIGMFLVIMGVLGTAAYAQETTSGAPAVEITIIPGGGTFFTEAKNVQEPSFGNYEVGGALAFNFSPYVGVEGEVAGTLGVSQNLQFGDLASDVKTPNFLNYNANLIVSLPTGSSVVPYVTGGVGGMSLFEKASLGINDTSTFLTGNVGAGVKWYAGRWGLRADYRFLAIRSNDDAPAFFGQDTRYGHRIYGGVMINVR
jgi:opacity protein-like surface antigen